MKKLIFLSILIILSSCGYASAQTPTPVPAPADDLVCISQSDAQECARRALEAKALREEVAELKRAREADKQSIDELKKRITELTVEASNAITRDAEKEKTIVRLTAVIEFLLKYPRKKFSLIDIF